MDGLTEDDLIDAAEMGERAKEFIESDLGKTLLLQAEKEELAWLKTLGDIDADDKKEIMKAQIEVRAARRFREMLEGLITIGENAKDVWRQQNGS
jgi:hypothetical protein